MHNIALHLALGAMLIIAQPHTSLTWFFDIATPNGFIVQQSQDLKTWSTYCQITNVNTNTFYVQLDKTNKLGFFRVATQGTINR